MKYKTLFRLMLKFLGVWLVVGAVSSIISVAGNVVSIYLMSVPGATTGLIFSFAGSVVDLLAGLYLFFGGRWIVDLAIPSNRPYCHECGYELTGAAGHACPECGTSFRIPPSPGAE